MREPPGLPRLDVPLAQRFFSRLDYQPPDVAHERRFLRALLKIENPFPSLKGKVPYRMWFTGIQSVTGFAC